MASSSELDRRRQGLSESKRRLLQQRLLAATKGLTPTDLARQADQSAHPASSAQRRFWILWKLYTDSPAYNMHVALHLRGGLDRAALSQALQSLAERHPALRTRFEMRREELWQVILEQVDLPLETISDLPEAADAAARDAALAQLCRQLFDLGRAPLARAQLLQVSPEHHVLLLCVHHIICDERSLDVLVGDLGVLYDSHLNNTSPTLAAVPHSYVDYAAWEQQRLPELIETQADYWRQTLRDTGDSAAPLPDRARPPTPRQQGALVHRTVPADVSASLRQLARAEQVTSFAPMLAAFATLLRHYVSQRDLCIGTPVSLRSRSQLADIVGLFLNTLVIRTRLPEGVTFRDLLRQVNQTCLEAYSNMEMPFDEVAHELGPDRDSNHNPLFDVMFVQVSDSGDARDFGTLDVEQRHLDCRICKVDLTLFFEDAPEGIKLAIEYDTDLYERDTAKALLTHLERLLEQFAEDPDRPVDVATLLDEKERIEVLDLGRGPGLPLPQRETLLERIDAIARTRPDEAAVVDADGTISYGELREQSERWARSLCDASPRPDCLAIMLGRSGTVLAAMLGAWRAGACYVPIDPGYPDRRIGQMLHALHDEAGREILILTDRANLNRIPAGFNAVCSSATEDVEVVQAVDAPADPEALAYVIFTSGSTGTPKAVGVSHRNLLASTLARLEVYPTQPGRFLLTPSFSFDSSVAGIYWTLASGGTLVLANEEEARDGRLVAGLIGAQQISHTLMLPSLYDLVLRSGSATQLGSLTTAIVAGEACSRDLVERHQSMLPAVELYNEYGPTEATVWATCENLTAQAAAEPVSIGRAIPGVSLLVLNERLEPVPAGVAGELCIAGPTVSVGYLGNDAANADRFVENVAGLSQVGRIYRSGDAARWQRSGHLEFLGRRDEQIKLRGHRVEPAEVASVLLAYPAITEAVVIPVGAEGRRGSAIRLAAYIVSGDDDVDTDALMSFLADRLPAFMVPGSVTVLETLPRTATGKVDRRALWAMPSPIPTPPSAAQPSGEVECTLAQIWSRLLKIDNVARNSNFFDLGGHSLLGVRMLLEIDQTFGCSLPLAALFESPTVAELANRIRVMDAEGQFQYVSPVQTGGSLTPLFCIHGAIRRLRPYLESSRPIYLVYRQFDSDTFADLTVEALAAAYLEEIRRIQPRGPYHLCGFSFGGQVAYEIARILVAEGERVGLMGLLDPPPIGDASYSQVTVTRKLAQIQSMEGLGSRLAFVTREVPAGLARIMRRRWTYILARLRERRGAPMETALLQERDRRNYVRASQKYRYPTYAGNVLLVMPERIDKILEATASAFDKLVEASLEIHVIRGAIEHEDMMKEPHCERLAHILTAAMTGAEAGTRVGAATCATDPMPTTTEQPSA